MQRQKVDGRAHEVYHLKSIHTNTVDRFLDHRGTTIVLYRNGHSLMVTPNRRPDWEDPGTRGMRRIETATVISARNNPSFNFYPNLVTPVDPTGCPFLLFWPTSDTSMRIETALSTVVVAQTHLNGHHRHEELDRRIGIERIPAQLRVQPR
jgi:hypothetical protein